VDDEELFKDFKRSADFAYNQFSYLVDLALYYMEQHPEYFEGVDRKGALEIAGAILEVMKVLS